MVRLIAWRLGGMIFETKMLKWGLSGARYGDLASGWSTRFLWKVTRDQRCGILEWQHLNELGANCSKQTTPLKRQTSHDLCSINCWKGYKTTAIVTNALEKQVKNTKQKLWFVNPYLDIDMQLCDWALKELFKSNIVTWYLGIKSHSPLKHYFILLSAKPESN